MKKFWQGYLAGVITIATLGCFFLIVITSDLWKGSVVDNDKALAIVIPSLNDELDSVDLNTTFFPNENLYQYTGDYIDVLVDGVTKRCKEVERLNTWGLKYYINVGYCYTP